MTIKIAIQTHILIQMKNGHVETQTQQNFQTTILQIRIFSDLLKIQQLAQIKLKKIFNSQMKSLI